MCGSVRPCARGVDRWRAAGPDERRADAGGTGKVGGRMNIEELEQIKESVRLENSKFDHEINVCMGTGCLSQHSDKIKDALGKAVEASGKKALVRRTGCMGLCAAGPLVLIDPEETLYAHMKAEHAETVVNRLGDKPVEELQCDLREHFDQQVH